MAEGLRRLLDERTTEGAPAAEPAPLRVRAAIVHDWFQGFHGAERTVWEMLPLFEPDPHVFTFHAARELLPPRLAAAIVRESRLARLPGLRQRGHNPGRWRWLLPYMPVFFERLDLRGYEVVVSSSHACAAGVRTPPETFHLCYCHTPMRYVWLPESDDRRQRGLTALGLALAGRALRRWDLRASRRPDLYVANSRAVAERIRRFYGRDAEVVPPPVAVEQFRADRERERDHFVWVHRLVPYKRPLEVAEAFAGLPELRLTMVGIGPLERELRKRLPPNVQLLGWLERRELVELLARAGGFVHVGEEDFGISMVEALASGTPVVGLARGGALDIVRPGVDGVLVEPPATAQRIRAAVVEVASRHWDAAALRRRAEEFSTARFRARLAALIARALER
ncbi:glycosyltransferase [Thermoleophilum album]|uniref:Glycosyltransferase Family 4 n=1 Tax=Thermoleophilum album TaxID=29539 RepID=A0A1H6FIN9_THEAL|nr:glycosyltransferase [Thermoleophilum album]SEH10282.1 Glycosyltransferase Family 4 [Thermoleophilum album]